MKKNLLLVLAFIAAVQFNSLIAQEDTTNTSSEESQNFGVGADFVNQYIWRGLQFSTSPNVQPYLTYTNKKGNFTIGTWSSYSLADFYGEVDIFASLNLGPFTVSLWDYFTMSQQENNHYFDYRKNSTTHSLEGTLAYNGPESFPIQLTWATFFYGYDLDENAENYYSSYFEAAYLFKWRKNELKVFAGITPWEGLYGTEFAMNNVGISNARLIQINQNFSIPISAALSFNPHQENIFLVLTIGLSAND